MNIKIKNTLIILTTLLLGIVIGFLLNGRLSQMRIDNMRQNYAQKGMDYRFMRALNPTPEQMKNLRPIFDKYNDIRMENMEEHWETQNHIFDDFENEIKPFLTDLQQLKLNDIKQNLKRKKPDHRGRQKRGNRVLRNNK